MTEHLQMRFELDEKDMHRAYVEYIQKHKLTDRTLLPSPLHFRHGNYPDNKKFVEVTLGVVDESGKG